MISRGRAEHPAVGVRTFDFNQYNNLYSESFWGEILFQFEEKFNEQNSFVHLYVINNTTSFRQKALLRPKGTKCKSSSSHFYKGLGFV